MISVIELCTCHALPLKSYLPTQPGIIDDPFHLIRIFPGTVSVCHDRVYTVSKIPGDLAEPGCNDRITGRKVLADLVRESCHILCGVPQGNQQRTRTGVESRQFGVREVMENFDPGVVPAACD